MRKELLIKSAIYKTSIEKFPLHFHNDCEILFITGGTVEIVINNKSVTAQKGDVIFLNSFDLHYTNVIKTPYKRYALMISPSLLDSYMADNIELLSVFKNRSENFQHCVHFKNFDMLINLLNKITSELQKSPNDKYSEQLHMMYIKELLIFALRNQSNSILFDESNPDIAKLIYDAQNYLDGHYHENIKIDKICAALHISPPYFSRMFKQITGLSPKQYLMQLRLNSAASHLAGSNERIIDVAYEVGFNDINNFIRKFRDRFEVTPSEFRKRYIPDSK